MKLNVVILAAGVGKRMRSNLPKVLHNVNGIPMLERVVKIAQTLLPEKIVVVQGTANNSVANTLKHLKVEWITQQEQLGTAHAVSQTIDLLSDDAQVLILYGDVPLISNRLLTKFINSAQKDQLQLITANLKNPHGFGRIIRNQEDHIVAIVEQKDANIEQEMINEINTGIMLIPAILLKEYLPKISANNAQKEYYLTDIIELAKKDNIIINGIIAEDTQEVLGVNDKYQLTSLERHEQQKIAKEMMEQGLRIYDASRFDLRGTLEFGKDVEIDINVIIENVSIDDSSYVGPNTILRNVKIGKNVKILANCVLDDAVIEDNCQIGPFARIRPGTHVQKNAQIGNFVELKKTTLGENSKANHLSYLGDATIGKNVNIGAGTITCNYDGVNKFPTIIEDNAFIGSDSQLVAPVKVGARATIGAGSTITENAPANKLTIARSRQVTIKDWKGPKRKKV